MSTSGTSTIPYLSMPNAGSWERLFTLAGWPLHFFFLEVAYLPAATFLRTKDKTGICIPEIPTIQPTLHSPNFWFSPRLSYSHSLWYRHNLCNVSHPCTVTTPDTLLYIVLWLTSEHWPGKDKTVLMKCYVCGATGPVI